MCNINIKRVLAGLILSSSAMATVVAIKSGGTSASTAPAAIANLGGVAKAGDTMTGGLTVPSLNSIAASVIAFLSGTSSNIQGQINVLQGATTNLQTQVNAKLARSGDTMTGDLGLTGSQAIINRALQLDAQSRVTSSSVTTTELGYLSGTTSGIQTQINNLTFGTGFVLKAGDTMTGALTGTTVNATAMRVTGNTANRVVTTNATKDLTSSSVTDTELTYLSGTTSSIVSRLGGVTSNLTPLNGVTLATAGITLNLLTDIYNQVRFFDDFLSIASGTVSTAALGWFQDTTGAGAAITTNNPPAGRVGIYGFSTGTTATGRAVIALGNSTTQENSTVLGGGLIQTDWSLALPNLQAAATQEFVVTAGFRDVTNAANPANGVYFRYDINSANWQCVTRAASIETSTTSSVAVVAGASTYHTLRITINAAATSVTFAINTGSGFSNVCTNTTNIPTAAIGEGIGIFKTVGTTARTINVDYMQSLHKFSTARF